MEYKIPIDKKIDINKLKQEIISTLEGLMKQIQLAEVEHHCLLFTIKDFQLTDLMRLIQEHDPQKPTHNTWDTQRFLEHE